MKWSLLITDVSVRNQTTKVVTTHNNTASNNFINPYGNNCKQAGAELGQAQPQLGLEARILG